MPADWSPPKRKQKDLDARWTKKHRKSYFGYKLSVSADKRCKLIRKIKVSTASEHDTLHYEDVLDPADTSRDVYADKGYINKQREKQLTHEGWCMHVQRKRNKDKPLSEAQKRRNRRIASPRACVEYVFAGMAQLGGKVLRSIGLARAAPHLHCKAATYNLRCLCYLREAKILAF